MKKPVSSLALRMGGLLVLGGVALSHGGVYRGPGSTVPPGAGGVGPTSAGGAGGASAPVNPGSGSTPGSTSQPPPAPGTGASAPSLPSTAGPGGDLSDWRVWWSFNQDAFLNLQAEVGRYPKPRSEDGFLSEGNFTSSRSPLRPSDKTVRREIVPALLAALEDERNNHVLSGTLIALAKIGDAPGESTLGPLFESYLSHSVQEIRETAAVSLGMLANPDSISTLEHLALDTSEGRRLVGGKVEVSYRTRAFAAYGLGLVGHVVSNDERKRIVRTLAALAEEPKLSTRDVKVAAVIALGLVPLELRPANEPAPSGKLDASRSREEQIEFLLRYQRNSRSRHYLVRSHVPRSVVRLLDGTPEALRERTARALLRHVGPTALEESRELRQSATLALGQIGRCSSNPIDVRIRQALIKSLEDTDQQVRFFSLIALGQVSGRPEVMKTGALRFDQEALASAHKHLLVQLRSGKGTRPWAALGLGILGRSRLSHGQNLDPNVSLALRESMETLPNPADVGACALACGMRKDAEAVKLLREQLPRFTQDGTRGFLALGLGLLKDRESTNYIRAVLHESKYRPEVLNQGAIALALMGDKGATPQLISMLEEARSLASQSAVARALGFVGDARAVYPLLRMLSNDQLTARARAFAALSLGLISDKEPLPWNAKLAENMNYRANTSTLTAADSAGVLDIL